MENANPTLTAVPLALSYFSDNNHQPGALKSTMFDIISIGHFAIDSILLPNRSAPFVVLGGSPTYVSLAAARLGAKAAVVSKVGADFPNAYLWWLKQEGADLTRVIKVEDAKTTRFELKYTSDLSDRALKLRCRAPPITVADLTDLPKARAVHVAPIAGEVTYEVVEKLRACADVLSIDPQGLVRVFDENGDVTYGSAVDKRILEHVDVFKSSSREIEAFTGKSDVASAMKAIHDYGVDIVITTLGAKGAAVCVEDAVHNVSVFKCEKVIDPTGAGDAFIGGFLVEYVRGEDVSWCSHVGSATASLVIEGIGPTSFGDRDEIYRRAHFLHEKEIKE